MAAVRRKGEVYGYQLVQYLTEHEGLELTESTVYPLLARLARLGYLSVTSNPSPNGPPRRYYRITQTGRQALSMMIDRWIRVGHSIQSIIGEDLMQEK